MKVHTLEQAKEWFLENHEEGVLCVKDDGTELFCRTYPEAQQFYFG